MKISPISARKVGIVFVLFVFYFYYKNNLYLLKISGLYMT